MSIRLKSVVMAGLLVGGMNFCAPTEASGQAKQTAPAAKSASLLRHDGTVVFVAYTPDGKQIITITYEGAIRKWDAASGKEVQQIEKAINAPGAMFDTRCRVAALSPDGKTLAVATYASVVNLYNVTSGKPIRQVKTGDDQMSGAGGIGFAADSKSIFTNRFHGREVTHWDLANGKELHKFGEALKGFNLFLLQRRQPLHLPVAGGVQRAPRARARVGNEERPARRTHVGEAAGKWPPARNCPRSRAPAMAASSLLPTARPRHGTTRRPMPSSSGAWKRTRRCSRSKGPAQRACSQTMENSSPAATKIRPRASGTWRPEKCCAPSEDRRLNVPRTPELISPPFPRMARSSDRLWLRSPSVG